MSEAVAMPGKAAKRAFGMGPGKFAMWAFICSDGMGFAGLFAAYFATRSHAEWWPIPGKALDIDLTALNTFVLICSSVTMVYALAAAKRRDQKALCGWLFATILGGSTFLGIQVKEYIALSHEGVLPFYDNFCATFYALTCYHGMHVFSGVVYLTCMLIGAARGRFTKGNYMPIEIVGLFWHFVDLVWILLFTFVYLLEPLPTAAAV